MSAPHMSAERMRELNRQGLVVKRGRAKVKHELKEERRTVRNLILRPPAALHRMETGDVLCMLPRVSGHRAARLLIAADVRWTRPFGRLTPREQLALVAVIEKRHPRLVRTA